MTEALTVNAIERLARAIFGQLSPMTGARATGTVTVTATAGGDPKALPANTYLLPVVDGKLRDDLAFKTVGSYTVAAASTATIAVQSNVGGARHNLSAGTIFRFDPPLEDFELSATLDTTMSDGADDATQLVKRVAFFEELDGSNPQKDVFAAMLGVYPALMLIWLQSEPAEGLTAGLRQGSSRGARKVRFTRESFVLYVVTGRLATDQRRRNEGLVVMQAASRLLTDRQRNLDGEQLSTIGAGVEINGRSRLARGERHYIYALRLRVNQSLQPIEERTFQKWASTNLQAALPGREAPEPSAPLPVVDTTITMP